MRSAVSLWLILAAICGVLLFQTSQKVNDGRERLAELTQGALKEKNHLRVLQAEWGYLNQPERLAKMAKQHLKLQPMKNHQFTTITQIDIPAPAAAPAAKTKLAAPAIKITPQPSIPAAPAQQPKKSFVWSPKLKTLSVTSAGQPEKGGR